jgi:hypothetical protein
VFENTLSVCSASHACGCITTMGIRPPEIRINKSRTYNVQFDKVWSAIINMIAEYQY